MLGALYVLDMSAGFSQVGGTGKRCAARTEAGLRPRFAHGFSKLSVRLIDEVVRLAGRQAGRSGQKRARGTLTFAQNLLGQLVVMLDGRM